MALLNHTERLHRSGWLSVSLLLGSLVLVTGVLYAAREIFIPIALAILFTFILAPVVTALRRRGVGRTWSVVLTVAFAFLLLGGIAAALTVELRGLANDLPAYRHNISRKIADLRLASRGGSLEKVQQTVQAVIQDVRDLEFIGLLLSSEPPLSPSHVFYQRLVAKDADEAQRIVDEHLEKHELDELYEQLLLPAAAACRHDTQRGRLTEADQAFAYQFIRQIIEDTGSGLTQVTSTVPAPVAERLHGVPRSERPWLLGQPAHDEADELALLMLAELLRADQWPMRVLSSHLLTSEALAEVEKHSPAVLCVGSLAEGSLFAARQFCKRLRARQPDRKVVLARWLNQDAELARARLNGLVIQVSGTLAETKNQLIQLAHAQSVDADPLMDVDPHSSARPADGTIGTIVPLKTPVPPTKPTSNLNKR